MQKLTPAEMFLNDNEEICRYRYINRRRNADMARIDPYTDFRRLSDASEATGLFDSFSSRATEHCRVLEAKLRQDIHFDVDSKYLPVSF